jgi:hypothetical protein
MDEYGYHCLSCPDEGLAIKRHDYLVNFLFKMAKKSGFNILKEQRYINGDSSNLIKNKERPDDLKILNFEYDDGIIGEIYYDLVVGNIFSKDNIKHGCKKRLWLAKKLEKRKNGRYGNQSDILGLGVECIGGHSNNLNKFMHKIANNLKLRTDICDSIWMNRIRSQFNAILMKYNAKMILSSGNLTGADNDISIELEDI